MINLAQISMTHRRKLTWLAAMTTDVQLVILLQLNNESGDYQSNRKLHDLSLVARFLVAREKRYTASLVFSHNIIDLRFTALVIPTEMDSKKTTIPVWAEN